MALRRLVEVLLAASLAVALSILTNGDARPLLVVVVICAVVLLAADWRWLRLRLPFARPLAVQMHQLAVQGQAILDSNATRAERALQVAEWERRYWRTLERGLHEKAVTLHRNYGDIDPGVSDDEMARKVYERLGLLGSLMVGTL